MSFQFASSTAVTIGCDTCKDKSVDACICKQGWWKRGGRAHCTETDFAWSFGAVSKNDNLSKTGTRDFFDIILDQKNAQELYLLPKSC